MDNIYVAEKIRGDGEQKENRIENSSEQIEKIASLKKQKDQNIVSVTIQNTPLNSKDNNDLRNQYLRNCHPTIEYNSIHIMNNALSQENKKFSMSRNGFFDAFYSAYVLHGNVQISADVIWMTVCDRLSTFVLANKEKCRHYFVSHEGTKVLSVFLNTNDPEFKDFPSKENRWDLVLQNFQKAIDADVKGDLASLLQNDFSTTKVTEQAAANIILMQTLKSYYSFLLLCGGCGIQKVLFEGTIGDYEKLAAKIKQLGKDYPIDPNFLDYLEKVGWVVKKFIETMKFPNKIDLEFWNGIFDKKNLMGKMSGPELVPIKIYEGWMKHFFNANKIDSHNIPSFRSSVPVQCVDIESQSQYQIDFQTEINGIEEVAPNTFRPIVHVAFKKKVG